MSLMIFNVNDVRERSGFISKVYTLLAASLVFCSGGALLGLSMPMSLYLPVVIVEFILLFAVMFLQRAYPLNFLLLFLFTLTSGITLGPTLNYYIAAGAGSAIPLAAGVTAVTFGGLSAVVHLTKKDFSFLQGILFWALLGMVAFGLLSMFFPLPVNHLLYAGIGVVVFSGFILVDTSRLIHRYNDQEYVAATLGLYLDVLNLFLMVLRLVGGGNNRR